MINQPYLLVMTLPTYVDAQGHRRTDELWQKDLVEHLVHFNDMTLFAPVEHTPPPPNSLPVDPATLPGKLTLDDLPSCASMRLTLKHLPGIAVRLWRAIGRAEIVHANAGGWPISFGWLAIPMAKLRGKFTVSVVESGSWRLGFQRPFRLRDFVEACLFESFGRVIVNLADVAVFTHAGYLESMLSQRRRAHGHVISASWINQANILTHQQATTSWQTRTSTAGPLRVVFAATLKTSKGIFTLIEAVKLLDQRRVSVQIDVYGEGGLEPEIARTAATLHNGAVLNLRGTLGYGDPFFQMLERYEVMLVPSLSDEQPRVIFDSFARALPVIASATAGNAQCVTDGVNGHLVAVGDAQALANAIEHATQNRSELAEMGIKALEVARGLTHDQMHTRRAAIIEAAFAAKYPGKLRPASGDLVAAENMRETRF